MIEQNRMGGFPIQYQEGPKQDLSIHFYSREELTARMQDAFEPVMPLREDIVVRTLPKTGSWAQWEGIWQRR